MTPCIGGSWQRGDPGAGGAVAAVQKGPGAGEVLGCRAVHRAGGSSAVGGLSLLNIYISTLKSCLDTRAKLFLDPFRSVFL